MKITRRMHNFFFDLIIACCLIASKWFEKSLWSLFSHLTDSNWSKRLQKSSQNVKLTIVFQFFFSMIFFYRVVFIEILMIYDQSFLWIRRIIDIMTYCFCFDVNFHTNDLIESNCCIMNVFDEIFRRFCFDFYLRNSVEFFNIEIKKSVLLKLLCL